MRKSVQYFFEAYSDCNVNSGEVQSVMYCLCDDGSVWKLYDSLDYLPDPDFQNKPGPAEYAYYRIKRWEKVELPEIPQD